MINRLGLPVKELEQPMQVRVANEKFIPVTHFVRLSATMRNMPIYLFLRVLETPLPIVL